MLERKKALKSGVVNVAVEKIRLETALEAARHAEDFDKVADVKAMLVDLEEIAAAEKLASTKDGIAELNARTRSSNFAEIQESEKAAMLLKRSQAVNEADPFARRKTAPMHAIQKTSPKKIIEKAVIADPEISNAISAKSLESLGASDDDEDLFASIDVTVLKEGTLLISCPRY